MVEFRKQLFRTCAQPKKTVFHHPLGRKNPFEPWSLFFDATERCFFFDWPEVEVASKNTAATVRNNYFELTFGQFLGN